VFLSQIDRLWNKIFWKLSVQFCHPRRIKTTDFTSYNSYTVEDKKKRTRYMSGCWLIVLS
jgi:hypothetical protein